jgi:hypothetical protein
MASAGNSNSLTIGIEVRSTGAILATLAYPITEAGTLKSSYVKGAAYLMVAAGSFLHAG